MISKHKIKWKGSNIYEKLTDTSDQWKGCVSEDLRYFRHGTQEEKWWWKKRLLDILQLAAWGKESHPTAPNLPQQLLTPVTASGWQPEKHGMEDSRLPDSVNGRKPFLPHLCFAGHTREGGGWPAAVHSSLVLVSLVLLNLHLSTRTVTSPSLALKKSPRFSQNSVKTEIIYSPVHC